MAVHGAHLMLRQHLPLWKADRVIEDTVSYCRRLGIAEVVWMIDVEAFNHGFTPVDRTLRPPVTGVAVD